MSTDTREALAALMVIAAECAQRKPLRGFEELTEATHIGHRQFGRAHEQADEDVRMLAVRLRAVFDTLAAALATQPAQPSAQGEAVAIDYTQPPTAVEVLSRWVRVAKREGRLTQANDLEFALNALLASAPAAPTQAVPSGNTPYDEGPFTLAAQPSAQGEAVAWMTPGYPQIITDEWKRENIDRYPWVKDYTTPLYASAPAAPASAQGEAVAWLVEWKAHGHGPQWWGFNHTPGKNATWCSDANNAIRFARKEDAERMRLHIIAVAGLTGLHEYERSVSVTEHMWEGPCRAN